MYKVLFTDLDETLLVNHHVPKFNLEAIKKAREKGVKVIPSTGRSFFLVQDIIEEIDTIDKENEYSICFNGGLIVENKNSKVLVYKGITYDQMKSVLDIGLKEDLCTVIFTIDACYFINPDSRELDRKVAQGVDYKVITIDDISLFKEKDIMKVFFVKRDMKYLLKLRDDNQELLDSLDLSATFSSNRYMEVVNKEADKGIAIKWLCDYLNIDINEAIAVGDNYNDLGMIQTAGLGVAVKCADEEIKKEADYVTEKDYDEGAIEEVIERFILNESI